MDNKSIVFFQVGIVFLVLAAVFFFYSLNTTSNAMNEYRFQMDRMSALASRCLEYKRDPLPVMPQPPAVIPAEDNGHLHALEEANSRLSGDNDLLMRENSELKSRLRDSADESLIAEMKQNIKDIAVDIDAVDVSREKISRLDDILRSIYKALSVLDLNLAKVSNSDGIPWGEIREQEEVIGRKFDELAAIVKHNQNLAQKVEANYNNLRELGDKISSLEDNKDVRNALSRVLDEKESLLRRLEAGEDNLKKIAAKVTVLEDDEGSKKEIEAVLGSNKHLSREIASGKKDLKILAAKVAALETRTKDSNELKIALERNDSLAGRLAAGEELLNRLKRRVRKIESDWKRKLAYEKKNKGLVRKLAVLEKKLNILSDKRRQFEINAAPAGNK